jgi:multimeric flavodoxin WrbA
MSAEHVPEIRKGQGDMQLTREQFQRRFRELFYDPAFDAASNELQRLMDIAWDSYSQSRKSPRSRKAGIGFADPEQELSVQWLDTREAIAAAQREHDRTHAPLRVLLICASARNDQTCPGEMSKTHRLCQLARETFEGAGGVEVDLLDLSRLTAEYGRVIYPCKACVSTAMPLCHWPCSCYPNHSLNQVHDWMGEIYPRWVAAHGVLIVTPVYWYQAPSTLKLMMDRLVCADGGNPDPTTTSGKDPAQAKALELEGWDYPRHLAGRSFGVVVHGDADGVETLRRSLTDWLSDMQLIAAQGAELGRYIGYYEPYATSHEALDKDAALQEEVRNTVRALVNGMRAVRAGARRADADQQDPRPK